MHGRKLRFDENEWLLFVNALNEILNGFAVQNFEEVIGAEREQVGRLIKKVLALKPSDEKVLTQKEAHIISNAIQQTIRELGIEEFQTRTGYDLNEGTRILDRLKFQLASCVLNHGSTV